MQNLHISSIIQTQMCVRRHNYNIQFAYKKHNCTFLWHFYLYIAYIYKKSNLKGKTLRFNLPYTFNWNIMRSFALEYRFFMTRRSHCSKILRRIRSSKILRRIHGVKIFSIIHSSEYCMNPCCESSTRMRVINDII